MNMERCQTMRNVSPDPDFQVAGGYPEPQDDIKILGVIFGKDNMSDHNWQPKLDVCTWKVQDPCVQEWQRGHRAGCVGVSTGIPQGRMCVGVST
ncbi:hypothetical protein FKM82_022066 [Ascaphus truei]